MEMMKDVVDKRNQHTSPIQRLSFEEHVRLREEYLRETIRLAQISTEALLYARPTDMTRSTE